MGRLGRYTDNTAAMITGPQLGFLTSLTEQKFSLRVAAGETITDEYREMTFETIKGLTKREASDAITKAKDDVAALRRTSYAAQAVEAPINAPDLDRKAFYVLDGQIYRLRVAGPTARRKGETYALVLNTATRKFDYAGYDIPTRLTESHKMNAEQAKAFGDLHAWCVRCQADLSDPKSIARGFGPVCAKYFA